MRGTIGRNRSDTAVCKGAIYAFPRKKQYTIHKTQTVNSLFRCNNTTVVGHQTQHGGNLVGSYRLSVNS